MADVIKAANAGDARNESAVGCNCSMEVFAEYPIVAVVGMKFDACSTTWVVRVRKVCPLTNRVATR